MTPRIKQGIIIWCVIWVCYIGVWLLPYLGPPSWFDLSQKPVETSVAENALRDTSYFQWYIVPFLLIVMYPVKKTICSVLQVK